MAEEDLTRAGSRAWWHGRQAGGQPGATPARHRSTRRPPGQTRIALRWLARARQRRLWAVEGIAVLACLVALGAYLNSPSAPDDEAAGPDGVPAGVGRPSGVPGLEGRSPGAAQPSPGLRPRQRPPIPPPAPPVRPVLTVTRAEVPAEVNLTTVGARDWVHWGLRGGDSTVRKRNGSGEIRDEGGRGARGGWDGNQETFSWRDGAPVESVSATPIGVYVCGTGNGFALAVAADGEPRTVRVYAGLWMARARLEARLSGGGPATTLRMEDPHTSQSTEFTVRFQAPKGTRLVLTWTVEEAFSYDCGSVGLQAVALR